MTSHTLSRWTSGAPSTANTKPLGSGSFSTLRGSSTTSTDRRSPLNAHRARADMPCVPPFTGVTDTASPRCPGRDPMTAGSSPASRSAFAVSAPPTLSPAMITWTGHRPSSPARRVDDASHPSRASESASAAAVAESAASVTRISTLGVATPVADTPVSDCAAREVSPPRHAATTAVADTTTATRAALTSLTDTARTAAGLTTRGARDAVDRTGGVVRDEQGAILVHQDVDRTAPAAAVRALPSGNEILVRHWLAVPDAHAHELGAGWRGPVPRTMERHHRITAPIGRKHRRAVEEGDA